MALLRTASLRGTYRALRPVGPENPVDLVGHYWIVDVPRQTLSLSRIEGKADVLSNSHAEKNR